MAFQKIEIPSAKEHGTKLKDFGWKNCNFDAQIVLEINFQVKQDRYGPVSRLL